MGAPELHAVKRFETDHIDATLWKCLGEFTAIVTIKRGGEKVTKKFDGDKDDVFYEFAEFVVNLNRKASHDATS